jgi:hypothetical protein
MNNFIQKSVQNGLKFLASNQRQDGRFTGLVSAFSDQFSKVQVNDNIFATALILNCLSGMPEAAHIASRATSYLLTQRSERWTWNYWERGSGRRPYPEDWDDTACALAGIIGHQAALVSAADQASVAKELISCETKPGGPYATWLMPAHDKQWRDIDVAVNANIGYMLSKLGVQSPGLEAYITNCINEDSLESPYYLGSVPALYFIARWYSGPARDGLIALVFRELRHYQSILHKAMLITAAIKLGCGDQIRTHHVRALLGAQIEDGWAASALYYEPPQHGRLRYAGSPELTTAYVIEALQAYLDYNSRPASDDHKPALKGRDEVVRIATLIARAYKVRLPAGVLRALNEGGKRGWTAYTLYDDILDGDARLDQLGAANGAMRRSLAYFHQALPESLEFKAFVEAAFARMDEANTWEVTEARNLAKLPDYADLSQLADRSWGQVIAPTGVLVAAGYPLTGLEVRLLHQFMQHYSIAKQLCDDAHDWQIDLEKGRVTAVVAMLLRACPLDSLRDRQRYFWEYTILEVNDLIRHHVRLARDQLESSQAIAYRQDLQRWLDAIERSCARAEAGRQAAQEFIKEFNRESLVK